MTAGTEGVLCTDIQNLFFTLRVHSWPIEGEPTNATVHGRVVPARQGSLVEAPCFLGVSAASDRHSLQLEAHARRERRGMMFGRLLSAARAGLQDIVKSELHRLEELEGDLADAREAGTGASQR